ncbi:hypothetical protein LAZ67_8003217 [Cordylochernes scorpioides]|uniref:Reverse transcriptase domain-containing protein n=1 Tax=Cordylochernes scorpioides TaxID=51811 RepID=A0ABY6KRE5_9ARAC|nr:hypothetical protein LAZ67_8003217 [Cordylochernes scorpioides]
MVHPLRLPLLFPADFPRRPPKDVWQDVRPGFNPALKLVFSLRNTSELRSGNMDRFRGDKAALNDLKNRQDIIITSADKGGMTVVMDKSDYINKMNNILEDRTIFTIVDEINKKREYSYFKKEINRMAKSNMISNDEFKLFMSNLDSESYIYGKPKVHKQGIPLRPIVAYHSSPLAPIARYVTIFLQSLIKNSVFPMSIANIPTFITEIANYNYQREHSLVSFDIDPNTIDKIIGLITLCLRVNIFTFDQKQYKQIKGSPMGSPLSTPLAEIVMRELDLWITSLYPADIILYRRYIDDIFCICTEKQIPNILASFNNYNNSLHFTIEKENNCTLPFLDIKIMKIDNRLQTTVYYKPTFTPNYIKFSSFCPISHKINTVKTLTKRIYTHCSLNLYKNHETQTVIQNLSSADTFTMNFSPSSLEYYIRNLTNKSLQLVRWRYHLAFNIRCEEANFIPPTLRIKDPVQNPFSAKLIQETQYKLLRSRTKGCHSKIRIITKTIKDILCLLSLNSNQSHLNDIIVNINAKIAVLKEKIEKRHNNKIEFWMRKYDFPAISRKDDAVNVINLSKTVLSKDEVNILSKGLEHRPIGKPQTVKIISGIEAAIGKLNNYDKNTIRNTVINILKEPNKMPPNNHRDKAALNDLKNRQDIIITSADKGGMTVVMDKSDYINKMNNILEDRTIFTIVDEINKKREYSYFKKEINRMAKSNMISNDEFKLFMSNLDSESYIYGKPKVHKQGIPLRPIVAYHSSPLAPIARYVTIFLQSLIKNSVFPMSIANFIPPTLRIKDPVQNPFSAKLIQETQYKLLRSRTKGCHSKIRIITKTIKDILCLLSLNSNQSHLNDIIVNINAKIAVLKEKIEKRHNNKIEFWMRKYDFPAISRKDDAVNVINLSKTVLSKDEVNILSKGLKHRPIGKPQTVKIISGIEAAIGKLNNYDKNTIRNTVINILKEPNKMPPNNHRDKAALNDLKNRQDIIITSADKGGMTVVMDKSDYINKMNNILEDRTIFTIVDEINKKREYSYFKKEINRMAKSNMISNDEFKLFMSNLDSESYIYGKPKVHKQGIPLRPIVAYHSSPLAPIARYVTIFLQSLIKNSVFPMSIANIPTFITEIANYNYQREHSLVSFDVEALYPSLPHSLILKTTKTFLDNNKIDPNTIDKIIGLITLCLRVNIFTFDQKQYKQIKGSPMGSPLSTPLAEIVMRELDLWITSLYPADIILYRRYIDDIFCICTEKQIPNILASFNNYNNSLHFTIEKENNCTLPF